MPHADTPMKHLSPQREIFAQEVARTGDASAAYRTAFPRAAKWRPESVHTKASRLLSSAKVGPRVNELRTAVEKQLGMTRARWIARWIKFANMDAPEVAMRALEQIGKALGYYAPEKHEVAGAVEHHIRVVGIEARIAAIIAMDKPVAATPPSETLTPATGKQVVDKVFA